MSNQELPLPGERQATGVYGPIRVCGQQLWVYTDTMSLMQAVLDDFRAATKRVWVENYIFRDDDAGQRLGEALLERAAAGLDVRLLYDPVGSHSASSRFFARLQSGGVQVHAYHPVLRSLLTLRLRRANLRDHRRLYVVDDAIGYFGGMNIGDYGGPGSKRPRTSAESAVEANWPDVHVRLAGPRQADLAAAFDAVWARVHGQNATTPSPWQLDDMRAAQQDSIWFFDADPRTRRRRPARALVPLFRRARRSITLLMAYFLPQGRVLRELVAARRRGVEVRVVVPADSDVKPVQFATRHMYKLLLARGIEVYERTGEMLHSKAIVIDGQWSVCGSCNLDPRSLWFNLEFFAVIHSAEFAAVLESIAAEQIRRSRRVTPALIRKRRWWERLVDAFAWWFRRWL